MILSPGDELYGDSDHPARDVNELLSYLAPRDDGRWLYRGQLSRYSGALLASGYRRILSNRPLIEPPSEDIHYSLRHVGRHFIGNFVWDREDFVRATAACISKANRSPGTPSAKQERRDAAAYLQHIRELDSSDGRSGATEWEELDKLVKTSQFSLALDTRKAPCDVRAMIPTLAQRHCPNLRHDHPDLARYIDDQHCNLFLNEILVNSLGFVAGSLVGQQYGFFSGMLDATTSLDVAAFFATHSGPDYSLVPDKDSLPPGVIYRFPRLDAECNQEKLLLSDYYAAPGTLVPESLLTTMESDVSVEDSLRLMQTCFEMRRAADIHERRYELLRFPKRCVAESRIGRQHAAVIVPDEIQKGVELGPSIHPITKIPVVWPRGRQLCQQSIEDLHFREGVRPFYFRHSSSPPRNELTAEYLWPSQDFFLSAVSFLFLAGLNYYASPAFALPVRLDLIDAGVGHLNVCSLHAEGVRLVELVNSGEPEEFILARFTDGYQRLMYLVFKAATLCAQAHNLADGQAIHAGLRVLCKARELDGSSCVLAALETVMLEAIGRQSEIRASVMRLLEAKRESADATTDDGEFLRFYGECLDDIYLWRFEPDFALKVFQLYESF